jgi:hypothetical protein
MKKSFIKKNIFALVVTMIFVGGIAYGAWSEPTRPFPSGREVPVHEGPSQVKDGDLTVGGTFIANKAAQFIQDALFANVIRGGSPSATNSTVFIGGTNAAGQKITQSLVLNGYARAKQNVNVGCVSTANNPCGITTVSTNQLCADSTGKIIFCDATTQPPVDTCPDGQVRLADGNCGYTVVIDAGSFPGTSISAVSIPGYTTFPGKLCGSGCPSFRAFGNHGATSIPAHTSMSVTATGTSVENLGSNVYMFTRDSGYDTKLSCYNLSQSAQTYYFNSSQSISPYTEVHVTIGSGNCT